jgi:hypothetical protein
MHQVGFDTDKLSFNLDFCPLATQGMEERGGHDRRGKRAGGEGSKEGLVCRMQRIHEMKQGCLSLSRPSRLGAPRSKDGRLSCGSQEVTRSVRWMPCTGSASCSAYQRQRRKGASIQKRGRVPFGGCSPGLPGRKPAKNVSLDVRVERML